MFFNMQSVASRKKESKNVFRDNYLFVIYRWNVLYPCHTSRNIPSPSSSLAETMMAAFW